MKPEPLIANYISFETEIGQMVACATSKGVCLLEFSSNESIDNQIADLEKKLSAQINNQENKHLFLLKKELEDYFNGTLKEFTVTLHFIGTPFQLLVWEELMNIPYGETRSYQQQSNALNNPKGIRAVASANGQNKIAIVVPCHRVIGQDGSLTGYAGGLERKQWLLDHERTYSGQPIQQKLMF